MRACLAVTLLVLVQPSPASCATCTSTSVAPRVLALAHRRLRKSPSVRQPFAEISGSISFSPPVFPFPETVPNFVCHFKGSLQWWNLWYVSIFFTKERGDASDGAVLVLVIFSSKLGSLRTERYGRSRCTPLDVS